MTDLFWPGAERAGSILSEPAWLADMVAVEQAWLAALVEAGVAPPLPLPDLAALLDPSDLADIAAAAEASGTPVPALVQRLRQGLAASAPESARWLHRGLTSQDVLDTALVLGLRAALDAVLMSLRVQAVTLIELGDRHRSTVQAGRTLTQYAVPMTFGLKAARWLAGVIEAAAELQRARSGLAAQFGGAVGTNAALIELCLAGSTDSPTASQRAVQVVELAAGRLGLPLRPPWPVNRVPLTRAGDALVTACDGFGRVAADLLVLGRPEIGELSSAQAGGSSTMPHKQNPVLAVLVRRAAVTAPGLAATLHQAAATMTDERAAGEWQAEWSTVRSLARLTVVAASHTAELLAGLHVHTEVMQDRVDAASADLRSEQDSMRELVGRTGSEPDPYLGLAERYLDDILDQARTMLDSLSAQEETG